MAGSRILIFYPHFKNSSASSHFRSNFTPVAPATQEYYVGSLGVKAQTVNSMILDFFGTGKTNMTRWLKWETLGL